MSTVYFILGISGRGRAEPVYFDNVFLANLLTLKKPLFFFFFHLFSHDAFRISMDDTFKYESPCPQREDVFKVEEYIGCGSSNGCRFKLVSVKSFSQRVCKEGESVNIGNVERKVCNPEQTRLMYCYTKNETMFSKKVEFIVYKKNEGSWEKDERTRVLTRNINYGVGCYCGWQVLKAGDSNENRAGKK